METDALYVGAQFALIVNGVCLWRPIRWGYTAIWLTWFHVGFAGLMLMLAVASGVAAVSSMPCVLQGSCSFLSTVVSLACTLR